MARASAELPITRSTAAGQCGQSGQVDRREWSFYVVWSGTIEGRPGVNVLGHLDGDVRVGDRATVASSGVVVEVSGIDFRRVRSRRARAAYRGIAAAARNAYRAACGLDPSRAGLNHKAPTTPICRSRARPRPWRRAL